MTYGEVLTSKEKSIELYSRYEVLGKDFTRGVSMKEFAKQCALIAVDEITRYTYMGKAKSKNDDNSFEYWQEVKQEIEKL